MKIVFYGSAGFAVPSLKILFDAGYKISAVVTAPDKLGGRGKKQILQTPVKKFALENDITVLQPKNLKSKSFERKLDEISPNLQVVVAFRMLPKVVWAKPNLGTFNLHSSLLPKYRGAAPINWAVINGETETGCTTFFIDEKIDTGAILLQDKTDISPYETAGELHDRLMIMGSSLVLETVKLIELGKVVSKIQDIDLVSHAPKIYRDDCKINFDQDVKKVHDFIRGMSPYPGAWTPFLDGELKIIKAKILSPSHHDTDSGKFIIADNALLFTCRTGLLKVDDLKFSGKRQMETQDFLRGLKI